MQNLAGWGPLPALNEPSREDHELVPDRHVRRAECGAG